jgi:hypothetical protein
MTFAVTVSPGPTSVLLGERRGLRPACLVEDLQRVLAEAPSSLEAWWSPCLWTNDRRASLAWEVASCCVVDLNYIDAAGVHVAAQGEQLERLIFLAATSLDASLWHRTPRGARIITVLNDPEIDPALWMQACEGMGIQIKTWLGENDLSCDRAVGRAGYETSSSESDLLMSRFLYTPKSLVAGIQREASVEVVRPEPHNVLDLALLAPRRTLQGLKLPDPAALEHERVSGVAADVEIAMERLREAERAPERKLVAVPSQVPSQRREEPPPPGDADAPPEVASTDGSQPAASGPTGGGQGRPLATVTSITRPPPPPPKADRPTIQITTDEEVVNDKAVKALTSDPRLYQRAHKLVTPLRGVTALAGVSRSADALTINEVPLAKLREMVATAANWTKVDATSLAKRKASTGTANEKAAKAEPIKWVPSHPPIWSVQAIQARGVWPGIRPLTGITEWPRLLPNGTLLIEPGYNATTGLYYEPTGEVDPVPDQPTADQVADAVVILQDAVCDFPFADQFGFPAWLAGLLTPLALTAFDGPTPIFLTESPIRGSGKSKLWCLVGRILTGRDMAGTPYTEDADEVAKKITASAIAGDATIFWDNVSGRFGCGPLDQATTARVWKNRVLGKMENTPELPLDCAWYASGNNVMLAGDIDRRVCTCRLEPKTEKPEERDDFKRKELLPWASTDRHRLLCAALTILRGFAVAGMPQGTGRYWGSFEGWSKVVKACIEWLGLPFQAAPTAGKTDTTETEELSGLLTLWEWCDRSGSGMTASDVLQDIETEQRDANLAGRPLDATVRSCLDALGGIGHIPTAKALGYMLRRWKGKICGGRAFREAGKNHSGIIRWVARKPSQVEIFKPEKPTT